jgi:hypothetical protein
MSCKRTCKDRLALIMEAAERSRIAHADDGKLEEAQPLPCYERGFVALASARPKSISLVVLMLLVGGDLYIARG